MKRTFAILLATAFAATAATAQETPVAGNQEIEKRIESLEGDVAKLENLKVSGYIQSQFQWGEEAASMKVGMPNENPEKSFNRFGIRRGRVKFTYEADIASAVFQLDVTEKGVGFKDAYLNLKDPWIGAAALKAGVFDRPFGYEISYSSSTRESPERSTIFQTLFPEERDLGTMLTLQAPKTSPWSIFKLEAGLFAGNGIRQETDSRKDFIGHLSATKSRGNFSFGAGASYYNGGVYQGMNNVYSMRGKEFTLNDNAANKGKFARREYVGFDAQFILTSAIGTTRLHGEYLFGQQPGQQNRTNSPNASTLPAADTWLRDFSGGYAMLVQSLGKSPVSLIAKYDRYDPNTRVAGNEIGTTGSGTGAADLAQSTIGVGALWQLTSAVRLTAYYDLNRNETSANLSGMTQDLKNDLFTLRLQYRF